MAAACRLSALSHISGCPDLQEREVGTVVRPLALGRRAERRTLVIDDISSDGMRLIQEIITVYDNYGFDTEVLVASVRHPMHAVEAAMMGADVITMPFNVIDKLLKHPLTDIGLEKFLADWEKVKK